MRTMSTYYWHSGLIDNGLLLGLKKVIKGLNAWNAKKNAWFALQN